MAKAEGGGSKHSASWERIAKGAGACCAIQDWDSKRDDYFI